MNDYLTIVVAFLTALFCIDTLADFLNLRYLKQELPDEFKGIYHQEKYTRHLHYQTDHALFEFCHRTFQFVATITFILVGGFNFLDRFARHFELSLIWTGLIFAGSLGALRTVLELPFSAYSTFVLEEKGGFNRTSPKTFASDLLKSIILSIFLGGPLFAGMIYFFNTAGSYGWLYSWIGVTLFQLVLLYLGPAVILPLFNKFSPLPEGNLRSAIESYARSRNFQLQGIFTMDSSKRSSKSNAFFTGFGRFRRLVLFDTLIEKHTPEELVAIIAHEIGHFERKHILKSIAMSIVSSALGFYVFGLFLNHPALFQAFKMEQKSTYASLILIGFLFSPILKVLSLFTQKLSRKYEFEADSFAVRTYGHPETLISALKKLSIDNMSHLTPHPLKVALDYTHPPILTRIRSIRSVKI